MRRIYQIFALGILGVLGFAFYSATLDSAAPAGTVGVETFEESAIAPAADSLVTEAGMFPAQDLTLVNNTGRPQLLNAFANW